MADWYKITDVTSGSQLFGGSAIYAFVESATFSGGNNVGNKQIQGVNTELDPVLDGIGDSAVGNNFNRRMGYNSYASFNNPVIKLTGNWIEELGSVNSIGSLLTPYKLWKMVNSDHQFKLTGGITIPNLLAGEKITSYKDAGYYQGLEGLPIVFTSPWQLSENYPNGMNRVSWTVTCRIDREE